MGRSVKSGLEYFPFDVDLFQDIKIRKLIKFQGGKAISVYALLLCFIYKNGYYMRWDEELPFIISEQTGFEEAYIQEVIKSCMKLGLFDLRMFERHKVITSRGIQERYSDICSKSKRKIVINEFNCISSEEMPISSEEMPISSEESTQRKEKEREYIESSLHSDSKSKIKISDSRSMSEVVKSLVGYFNLKMDAKEIPRIYKLGERRRQFLEARLKEYGEAEVRKAIDNAAESVFLNGGNHRGFIASFEWIFRPNNFPKVLEGNYKNNNNFYAYQASDQSATQRLNTAAGIVKRLLAEDDARGYRQEELPY